jgi:hypothetical protein
MGESEVPLYKHLGQITQIQFLLQPREDKICRLFQKVERDIYPFVEVVLKSQALEHDSQSVVFLHCPFITGTSIVGGSFILKRV